MADSTTDEESLISQEDIDKLMDSSSIEEVEEKFSADDSDDELGELSQDDIDALMNANAPDEDDEMDEIDELSQADIDKTPGRDLTAAGDDVDGDDDDLELISQEDIDSLMNADDPVIAEETTPPQAVAQESAPEEIGELSQDDIDALMNADAPDDTSSDEDDLDDGDDLEMISQEDIKSLIDDVSDDSQDEDIAPDKVINEKGIDEVPEDDWRIDESEAAGAQECLVTQATIDDLIKNFGESPEPETALSPEAAIASETDETPSEEPVILDEPADPDPLDTVELDEALDESDDTVILEDDEDDDDDLMSDQEGIAQEDIDSFLLDDEDDEVFEDDDLLISQDDIDTLLMAADQEDEDVLGDLMSEDLDDSIDDDDFFDDSDEEDDLYDQDQVVLEREETSLDDEEDGEDDDPGKKWYQSKLVLAGISGLIFLGIVIPVSYFFFFSGPEESDPLLTAVQPSVPVQQGSNVNEVNITIIQDDDLKRPGNITLDGFIILSPATSTEMSYITADISIDYSDQRVPSEINNNLSFYRELIYDSINKSLSSAEQNEMTQADILWLVETALKKVLPGNYIDRVSFKTFKSS